MKKLNAKFVGRLREAEIALQSGSSRCSVTRWLPNFFASSRNSFPTPAPLGVMWNDIWGVEVVGGRCSNKRRTGIAEAPVWRCSRSPAPADAVLVDNRIRLDRGTDRVGIELDNDSASSRRALSVGAVVERRLPSLSGGYAVLLGALGYSRDRSIGNAVGERIIRTRFHFGELRIGLRHSTTEYPLQNTEDSGLRIEPERSVDGLAEWLEPRGVTEHVALIQGITDVAVESRKKV